MRRRSPERVRVWRDLLDAWKRSDQTVNAFCRDRKLTWSNWAEAHHRTRDRTTG